MKELFRTLLFSSGAIGLFLLFGAASSSDYYVMELGKSEPAWIAKAFVVGAVMLVPMALYIINFAVKAGKSR